MVYVGGKALYFEGVMITTIYKKDGEFSVRQVPWSLLQGRYCGNEAVITFFGEEKSSLPSLVVLGGNVESIGSKIQKYGIVSEKSNYIDENGNIGYNIAVKRGEETTRYKLTYENGKDLPECAFISYFDDLLFSDSEIAIVSPPIDLTQSSYNWMKTVQPTSFKKGTVEKIDNKMVHLEDGSIYCMHPNQNFFNEVVESNSKNKFFAIDHTDIEKGDTVFINVLSDGIRGVIVRK
jgi:hypothetical protein